ncbi:hypothetical protein BVY03_03670 [bacterium K02(2017)]|nr:hypothetical protein BVY03_03670 [bacterium K02(2017)]
MTAVFHTTFFWVFLGFYLLHEIVHLTLELLNYKHAKKQNDCPGFYQKRVTQAVFEKSKAYTLEKIIFNITAHLAQIPFFWILIFRNGFNTFDYYAATHGGYGTLHHSVLFCIYLTIYFGIVGLPFKIYSTFVIEEKYGFNKMTFGLFLTDFLKSLVIGSIIGIPLMYLVFWFMQTTGDFWWISVWAAITVFQLILVTVYPTFLAPLFNKFTPLPDGELKDKITSLSKKVNMPLSGIFLVDGSKRSGHSNAYFAGMGRFKRIVLFDTLLKQLDTDELVSVLAHEMGHYVKKHIRNFMIISTLTSLIGFYILSLLINWADFYTAFNISEGSSHAALVIFMIASEAFTFTLTPLTNLLSRKNEFEADQFSVETTNNKTGLKSSLLKLTRDNLSNMTPHPAYSFYHYSHPTTVERADAIDNIKLSHKDVASNDNSPANDQDQPLTKS